MKHSEFSIHRLFIYQGREYICTDIGQRTIIAVLFSDVREDWWLHSTPYPGAMSEAVFDENQLPACEPVHKTANPPPPQTPPEPPAKKSMPPPPAQNISPPLPPLRLLVLATVFYVLGIVSLIYCVSSSLHTRAFLAHAVRVDATITSVEDWTDRKGLHRFTPTFTFTDAWEKTWHNASSQSESTPRQIGSGVAVLYDPQNPAEARIEDFWNTWATPLTSGLAGLLMLGAGAAVGNHFSKLLRQAKGGR